MRYYTHLGNYCTPRNNLQKAAAAYLHYLDGRLVADAEIFLDHLQAFVEDANRQHPKCAPLEINVHGLSGDKGMGIGLGGAWTVGFYLYEVKEK
ncbi:MAG: hypothetical protein QM642_09395 [Edaphocola sp.]